MKPRRPPLPTHEQHALMTAWAEVWGVPGLERRVKLSWSGRMHRSLGRCLPTLGVVRINDQLAEGQEDLLTEVLCHELAHVAACELHGRLRRPHGGEWAALMRAAGYPPRASICVQHALLPPRAGSASRRRYLHCCPVCGASRASVRKIPQWRCARCMRAGRDGRLVVTDLLATAGP